MMGIKHGSETEALQRMIWGGQVKDTQRKINPSPCVTLRCPRESSHGLEAAQEGL